MNLPIRSGNCSTSQPRFLIIDVHTTYCTNHCEGKRSCFIKFYCNWRVCPLAASKITGLFITTSCSYKASLAHGYMYNRTKAKSSSTHLCLSHILLCTLQLCHQLLVPIAMQHKQKKQSKQKVLDAAIFVSVIIPQACP